VRLPVRRAVPARGQPDRDGRRLVLIIEDDPGSIALLRSWLEPEGYAIAVAATGEDGLAMARELNPDAVLLDLLLPRLDGWEVLQQLRLERRTRSIPILVVSVVDDQQLGLALGAADYFVKPVDRDALLDRLAWVTRSRPSDEPPIVLAIDADDNAQAAYRAALDGAGRLVEARTGATGRTLAHDAAPDAILLDLSLPDVSSFALLAELKAHPGTRDCPVFAVTNHPLSAEEKERLTGQVVAVLEKREAPTGLITWLTSLPTRERPETRVMG
jgi:CheY-like chemotaxis protein